MWSGQPEEGVWELGRHSLSVIMATAALAPISVLPSPHGVGKACWHPQIVETLLLKYRTAQGTVTGFPWVSDGS